MNMKNTSLSCSLKAQRKDKKAFFYALEKSSPFQPECFPIAAHPKETKALADPRAVCTQVFSVPPVLV